MINFVPMKTNIAITRFARIAYWEGVSFLALLFIAMPLKYFLDIPIAVTFAGWAHGLLTILYFLFLTPAREKGEWSWKFTFWAVAAAFIPFATFALEKQLLKRS
jgi:integral membrane protein